MRLLSVCLVFMGLVWSCQNNKGVPKDVLGEKQMRTVLWDMMRADEWVTYEHTKDSTLNRNKRSLELYQKVFEINKTTAVQFKKSFQYYQTRPDLLKPILDSIQRKGPHLATPVL